MGQQEVVPTPAVETAGEVVVVGRKKMPKRQVSKSVKAKRSPEETGLLKQLRRILDEDVARRFQKAEILRRLIEINEAYSSFRYLARAIGESHATAKNLLSLRGLIPAAKDACLRGMVLLVEAYGMGRLPAPKQEKILAAHLAAVKTDRKTAMRSLRATIQSQLLLQAPSPMATGNKQEFSAVVTTISEEIRSLIGARKTELQPKDRKALAKSLRQIAREQTAVADAKTDPAAMTQDVTEAEPKPAESSNA